MVFFFFFFSFGADIGSYFRKKSILDDGVFRREHRRFRNSGSA